MKKLKLNLDDLKVESFETVETIKKSKGTVVGNASNIYLTCKEPCWVTAEGHETCNHLCYTHEYESCEAGAHC